jgi:hypothetical protein
MHENYKSSKPLACSCAAFYPLKLLASWLCPDALLEDVIEGCWSESAGLASQTSSAEYASIIKLSGITKP